jgi:glutamine synthetase
MLAKWRLELSQRIIPTNAEAVRRYRRLHGEDADGVDERAWSDIHALRLELMKDTDLERSLFSRIRDAIDRGDDAETSRLQVEMNRKMAELDERYRLYARNLIDIAPDEVGAGVGTDRHLMAVGTSASP